jgi:alkanesulfonate monooxygenase SsuD/methylene tetrahydromethanopterin reductase-like flavin-dependent oxidoreductase (luciferase family)
VLAPYRLNAALLAKEGASVHVISGGRLQLGLGLGWREDDYEASGIDFSERGRRLRLDPRWRHARAARGSKRRLEDAWKEAGRDDKPAVLALAYFSLGDRAQENAESHLGHYYAARGEETARAIIDSAAKDADTVRGYIQAFTEAGCDELFFCPCSADPEQVDLLAAAAL